MTAEPYWIVDAFADRPFTGNPAAVLLPKHILPDPLMQRIAAENNLSETAFAVRQGDQDRAPWRLRWFTPTTEVDLCGHATLATAFVLSLRGEPGPFYFETRSGRLTATLTGGAIALDLPARDVGEIVASDPRAHHQAGQVQQPDLATRQTARPGTEPLRHAAARDLYRDVAAAIGTDPVRILQGADLIAVLPDAGSVIACIPGLAAIAGLPGGALIVTAAGGEGVDITSRYFAPGYGIDEDPVTGAMHTQIVPYWAKILGRVRLRCHQASARGGTMTCTAAAGRVIIEGQARLYAQGELYV